MLPGGGDLTVLFLGGTDGPNSDERVEVRSLDGGLGVVVPQVGGDCPIAPRHAVERLVEESSDNLVHAGVPDAGLEVKGYGNPERLGEETNNVRPIEDGKARVGVEVAPT